MLRQIERINRDRRIAKLAAQEADCIRADEERRVADRRLVDDWLVRFHGARNARCEGQKNFRGIGQVA